MYNPINSEYLKRMGQMLSHEDDDERQYDVEPHEVEPEPAGEVKEKPKRRRNPNAAIRSRKSRVSAQGRTRRKAFE